MSTARTLTMALLAGLCLRPTTGCDGPAGRAAVLRAGSDTLPLLSYDDLGWDPESWIGQPLRLRVQYHSLIEDWNPYLTRFGTRHYVGFNAWTDEQRAWVQEDYEDPHLRLYARKDGAVAKQLQNARPHQRFELVCVVREIFGGQPWTEVVGIEQLAQEVPEGSVLHAIRGIEFMRKRTWSLAASQFERALAAPLPAAAKEEFERLTEHCVMQRDSMENRVYREHFRARARQ